MTRPTGWRREPARHALAAKGIETTTRRAHAPSHPIPPGAKTMSKEEFEHGYIYGAYPGLTGYAYKAEFISEEQAKKVMQEIMKGVDWIEVGPGDWPVLHMKDGRELYVMDTGDFPMPTSEDIEGIREEQED